MNKREYVIIHVCKGDKIPRDKHGNKPGYMPCSCALHTPKRGQGEAHKSSIGKTKSGHVQVNYHVPLGAPAHVSKDGKAYASVHHHWSSPGNIPEGNANLYRSAIDAVGKPQGKRKPRKTAKTVFGQTGKHHVEPVFDDLGNIIGERPISREKDKEQPEVFRTKAKGRKWAYEGKPEDIYPHGNRRKK